MAATNHFLDGSDRYARHRPTYPPALAEALAALAPRRTLALDVGCGTGQLSVLLGDCFDAVLATDASAEQIAHASPHPHVRYRQAPAEQACADAGSVDLVVAAQAAHWFDLPAFYAAAQAMAAPGAVIALVTYGVLHIDDAGVEARFRQFYWHEIAPYWPPERRHVERRYADMPFPFAELEFPDTAIVRDWSCDDLLGYVDTWSASRQARKAGHDALIAGFATDLRAAWGDPALLRRIVWPLAGRIGQLRAA
ncbi:MAG: class I SAM-dependent methyltransferase [Alphaproteobacteria bacterium]